jgi:hypothetical protein
MSIADVSQVCNEVVRELSLQLTLHEAAAQRSAAQRKPAEAAAGGRSGSSSYGCSQPAA